MTVNRTRAARSGTQPPLFPVLHGAHIKSEPIRESLPAQFHAFAQSHDALCGRIVNDPARKRLLASHVGEDFA